MVMEKSSSLPTAPAPSLRYPCLPRGMDIDLDEAYRGIFDVIIYVHDI